jgi:hypothetical protein
LKALEVSHMSSISVVAPEWATPRLAKASPVSLRDAGVTESWLEDVIEKQPAIIGLGDDLVIVENCSVGKKKLEG